MTGRVDLAVATAIGEATGQPFALLKTQAIGGGCVNSALRFEGEAGSYFVKFNRRELLPMFEAEAEGLDELAASQTLRVPRPVCSGVVDGRSYLVLEFIEMRPGRGACERLLGQRLAAMHQIVRPYFGWHRDNTIGSNPQPNQRHADWIGFWAAQRLGFQLELAANQGFSGRLQREGGKLLECLPTFFQGYQARPALLHGDLWGGNHAADEVGEPVVFDPACYYGDREADLAMTELFGGFGGDFYAAYAECYPLDRGYVVRKQLYNLYHVINHLNLFGGAYLAQAESLTGRLLAEVR